MNIFESLENLNVSEECFDEIMGLVEEVINEVSVNMWKQAAQNSIPTRRGEEAENDTEYSFFNGRIPRDQQKSLDKEHAEREDNLSDRRARAEYLAKALPNSNRRASELKKVANKAVEPRSNKTDKYRKSQVENVNKAVALGKEGNKVASGKKWDKASKSSENASNSLEREDHARMLANKTLRASDSKNPEFKETKGAMTGITPYKETNKETRERLARYQKEYEKTQNDNNKTDKEKENARNKLELARRAAERKFSSHKI